MRNTLLMVVEEGILADVHGKKEVKKFQMWNYIKSIVNDYGVSEEIAKAAIIMWMKAFEIEIEDVIISEKTGGKDKIKIENDMVDYS